MSLDSNIQFHCGDALEIMAAMPDNSIDLIATDPPYFKVKSEWWDRQWDTVDGFLAWIGQLCEQWQRILRPNGSLYVFAWSRLAAEVECEVKGRFNVLNSITWDKPPFSTKAEMFVKEDLRAYFPASERIILAEHYGADGYAKGEAGYTAKCDELRGFSFESLRAYLDGERRRAGIDKIAINEACGFSPTPGGMASRHYFSRSQWWLPTQEHYETMQHLFNTRGRHPAPPYEDYHDAPRSRFEPGRNGDGPEYLRADYEDLRRPFFASSKRPYTDVWTFPTVSHFNGKHPCEKPVPLMEHIILTSSKPGAVVLDCFMGRGSTAVACLNTGRAFIGCDVMDKWVKATEKRIREHLAQPMLEGLSL